MGPKNPLRVNFDLRRDFNVIWVVQSPRKKHFAFADGQISATSSPRPFPARGADRESSRNAGWDVVDARASARKAIAGRDQTRERFMARKTNDVSAFAKASADLHLSPAKPLGEDGSRVRQNRVVLTPVAGAKSAEACRPNRAQASHQSADDGDKTNSLAGEGTA
jgi:hypothetical protein